MSCWLYLNVAHRLAKVKFVQGGLCGPGCGFLFLFHRPCPWEPEEALDAEVSPEESERGSEGASRAGLTQGHPEPGSGSDNSEVSRES